MCCDIALIGGSFNPVHLSHMLLAPYIQLRFGVPEVWFVPTIRHAFGKPLIDFEHRLNMLRIATRYFGEQVKVSDIERRVPLQTGYTIDLVKHVLGQDPSLKLGLVIGSDVASERAKWKSIDELNTLVQWLVVERSGFESQLQSERGTPVLPELSSSEVRARLQAGRPVDGWLPSGVEAYIQRHQLYRSG